jgi:parallel beta-helix repeat protein
MWRIASSSLAHSRGLIRRYLRRAIFANVKISMLSELAIFFAGISSKSRSSIRNAIIAFWVKIATMAPSKLGALTLTTTVLFFPLSYEPQVAKSVPYRDASEVTRNMMFLPAHVAAPYTCVVNYYVSKSGSDNNSGLIGSPWLTVSRAISALTKIGGLHGGVCVNVGPGTYTESNYANGLSGRSDTPTGYLVFRSSTAHRAIIQVPLSQAALPTGNSFRFDNAHYIVVDGFVLVGQVFRGSTSNGVALNAFGGPGDHIKVLNNIIHHHGGAGIGAVHTDYLVAEGNVIYGNANSSTYQVSGISSWQAVASDSAAGFHTVIRNNIVFENAEVDDGHSVHTDGNGIIIDDFRNTQAGSKFESYAQETLIENNLTFGNGGSGIHIFLSDHVTVRNNTSFNNNLDSRNPATWRGGIDVLWGASNKFVNNISVANTRANRDNRSYVDASTDFSNMGNIWKNNLSFDGTPGQASILILNSSSTINTKDANLLGSDPLFADASAADFTLRPGSPAIDSGTTYYGLNVTDLAGRPRTYTPDMGAYEWVAKAIR